MLKDPKILLLWRIKANKTAKIIITELKWAILKAPVALNINKEDAEVITVAIK